MSLFGIKNGLEILDSDGRSYILRGSAVPSEGAGVEAPVGSLYLKSDGVSYKKTGAADTDWQPYSEIEGGGLLWSTISGTYTAEASRGYVLDSSGGAFTVTMPASPELGDSVGFAGTGDIATNNVTVDFNSNNMNGSADDLVIDLDYCYFELLYTGDDTGWVLSNTDESGNIDSLQAFVGNDDNTDAGVTEYTEENYIVSGDSLETSVDKLDMSLYDVETTLSGANSALEARVTTNEGDISTNASAISTNAGNISTNAGNISTNAGNIATNTADIATNASGIAANAADIITNTNAISTNATDIDNLESFTGSAGASSTVYTNENYIASGDPLDDAIEKLDAALKSVSDIATTGVNWRQSIEAATSTVVNTTAGAYSGSDYFGDDEEPYWDYSQWQDGDQILSTHATTSGIIYTWNAASDKWDETDALGANDAVAVRYDFLDSPGSQEDGAAYMMLPDESGVVKIADFDLESAATIGISEGYTATSGTISSTDSVESAIEKLDYRTTAAGSDIDALEARVTTNEGDISTNASAISTNAGNISTNAGNISTNAGNIATNTADIATNASGIAANAADIATNAGEIDDLEAAVGSSTGVAGMGYTSTVYVTDGTSAVAAVSALDSALETTDATVSGLSDTVSTNYTYLTNVDTAHDNLANAVLTEASTSVAGSATGTVLDTVTQTGTLAAKWFVVAYDGSGNRYAAEIYGMHDGSTNTDITEYAILNIGTALDLTFAVAADGTDMTLTVDNGDATGVTIKTQRTTVSVDAIDTTAVIS
jgi:hypothetical protein